MMKHPDKWFFTCRNCGDEREAIYENAQFMCTVCGKIHDEEDVTDAYNPAEVERYYQEFKGAKIAGMIDEKDVPRERFRR